MEKLPKTYFMKLYNPQFSNHYLFIFKITAGKKVAIKKDKNNKDWETKGLNASVGTSTPTNKLLEKSGKGNIKNPAINPAIMEI